MAEGFWLLAASCWQLLASLQRNFHLIIMPGVRMCVCLLLWFRLSSVQKQESSANVFEISFYLSLCMCGCVFVCELLGMSRSISSGLTPKADKYITFSYFNGNI
ncbi:unnamed protein product [Ceratitis capitata]|uniref:(Mediterranean fruit fly) hypothetical protein n=1 Tax=Ceratitis capitata TaxID=7213 RepID=A0A811UCU6_CERCA|nr:unnamed protein product [Ceratitis capitata]